MMVSIAELGSLDERNEPLLGRYYKSSHVLRQDGKSNSKRLVGAAEKSVTASGPRRKAHENDWWFERSVAENAYDMANDKIYEDNIKINGRPSFAEAAPVTAAIDGKWLYKPCEWSPERRRTQGGVSYAGNGYKRTSKPAAIPESLSNTSRDHGNWRTPNHSLHPHWRPNEQVDFPPYQPLSIPDSQLIIHNTPSSPSAALDTRPSDGPYQASIPPHLYRSNPDQPSLPQQSICGKPLEVMEVEAALILMVIRHQTPEAAAVAVARELRLAQEHRSGGRGARVGVRTRLLGQSMMMGRDDLGGEGEVNICKDGRRCGLGWGVETQAGCTLSSWTMMTSSGGQAMGWGSVEQIEMQNGLYIELHVRGLGLK